MQLIGMLDSPYVRRVAVSLQLLGLPFEHRSISVFSTFEQFRRINPVVKAPSLVCDDGTVLMDSTLILDHLESTVSPEKRLLPTEVAARRDELLAHSGSLPAALVHGDCHTDNIVFTDHQPLVSVPMEASLYRRLSEIHGRTFCASEAEMDGMFSALVMAPVSR